MALRVKSAAMYGLLSGTLVLLIVLSVFRSSDLPPAAIPLETRNVDVDDAEFEAFLRTVGRTYVQGAERARLREEWLRKSLFAQEAKSAGLDQAAEYQAALAQFEREALAQRYVDHMLEQRLTDKVLTSVYAAKRAELAVEEIHLAAMLIPAHAGEGDGSSLVDSLLKQMVAGNDFAALAKEYSSDISSAGRGGDLGWMPSTVAMQRFGSTVFEAEPGSIVGPLPAPQGTYLVKVLERKRTRIPEFSEVRRQLVEQLRMQVISDLERELKSKG